LLKTRHACMKVGPDKFSGGFAHHLFRVNKATKMSK
jgi:hypothetical protein